MEPSTQKSRSLWIHHTFFATFEQLRTHKRFQAEKMYPIEKKIYWLRIHDVIIQVGIQVQAVCIFNKNVVRYAFAGRDFDRSPLYLESISHTYYLRSSDGGNMTYQWRFS